MIKPRFFYHFFFQNLCYGVLIWEVYRIWMHQKPSGKDTELHRLSWGANIELCLLS